MNIDYYLEGNVPFILWGSPGSGKSAWIADQAKMRDAHLETIILSQIEASDLIGLPIVVHDLVRWAPPAWALRLRDALHSGKSAWIFFDELSAANPSTQAAALRLIQERQLGDIDLHGIRVIAAANPAGESAGEGLLSAPTLNRFAHIDWIPDLAEWGDGEMRGWGKSISPQQAETAAKMYNFLRKNAKLFAPPIPEDINSHRAWPSPRSWSAAIRLISSGLPIREISSVIGIGASAEYMTWHATQLDLPEPASILEGAAWPTDPGILPTVISSVCAHAISMAKKSENKSIHQGWAAIEKLRADQARLAARQLLRAVPEIFPKFGEKLIEKIYEIKK